MKKCILAATVLALLLTASACGTSAPAPESGTLTPSGENRAAGEVTITPAPQENDGAAGALAGGSYRNGTAHLRCTLDESWLLYNEAQLSELNGVVAESGAGALAENGNAVYDMYAVSTDGLMTINVTYQNLGLLSGSSMTAQDYAERAVEPLTADLTDCGFTDVSVQVTSSELAGTSGCPTITVTAAAQAVPMYERIVCIQAGNYIYCVTLCSFTEDVTADMAALFHRAV